MSSKKPNVKQTPISASALAFSFSTPKSKLGSKAISKDRPKTVHSHARAQVQGPNPTSGDPLPLPTRTSTTGRQSRLQSAVPPTSPKIGSHVSTPGDQASTPIKFEYSTADIASRELAALASAQDAVASVRSASPSRHSTPLRSITHIKAEDAVSVSSTGTVDSKSITALTTPGVAYETPRRTTTTSVSTGLTNSALKPLGAYNPTTPLPPRFSNNDLLGANAEAGPSAHSKLERKPLLSMRKLNDVALMHETPDRVNVKQTRAGARMAPLNETILSDRTADDLFSSSKRKAAMLIEEDEGIGVSPRGKRIAKWAGRGPPPPSVHLSNLLSSSNASLHLFYISLQHTLYPSHRDRDRLPRARQQVAIPAAISSEGAHESALPKGPSPLGPAAPAPVLPPAFQHIQTAAPVRLQIDSAHPIGGPMHYCTMFWCDVLKWHKSIDDSIALQTPAKVLVVFQTLPHECPKLGVDPRLLALRMTESRGGRSEAEAPGANAVAGASVGGKKWQVGIWQSSEMILPFGVAPQGCSARGCDFENGDGGEEQMHQTTDTANEGGEADTWNGELGVDETTTTTTSAVLATRYLIAEQPLA